MTRAMRAAMIAGSVTLLAVANTEARSDELDCWTCMSSETCTGLIEVCNTQCHGFKPDGCYEDIWEYCSPGQIVVNCKQPN
jgi:hypothetical protein